jgi:hypothetical protein
MLPEIELDPDEPAAARRVAANEVLETRGPAVRWSTTRVSATSNVRTQQQRSPWHPPLEEHFDDSGAKPIAEPLQRKGISASDDPLDLLIHPDHGRRNGNLIVAGEPAHGLQELCSPLRLTTAPSRRQPHLVPSSLANRTYTR